MNPSRLPRQLSHSGRWTLGLHVVLTVLSWSAFAFLQLIWIPNCKREFDEFGLSLPSATKQAIEINHLLLDCALAYVFPMVAILAMLPLLVLARKPSRRRAVILVWLTFLILPPALVSVGSLMAVGLPLIKLGEGLAK